MLGLPGRRTARAAVQARPARRDLIIRRRQAEEGRSERHSPDYGDAWTFVAIDADTKLVPTWYVGQRTADDAWEVLTDLRSRLDRLVQLTTDGPRMYLGTVPEAFDGEIDYAMLIKEYGSAPDDGPTTRYSPAPCTGIRITEVTGAPDPEHIATSYVERQNLTIGMGIRRFARLANAFSKKLENLTAAVSLHFMYYNFGRPAPNAHQGRRWRQDNSRDGCWRYRSRLDARRNRRAARFKLTHYPCLGHVVAVSSSSVEDHVGVRDTI
jgi:IS1 family transposase